MTESFPIHEEMWLWDDKDNEISLVIGTDGLLASDWPYGNKGKWMETEIYSDVSYLDDNHEGFPNFDRKYESVLTPQPDIIQNVLETTIVNQVSSISTTTLLSCIDIPIYKLESVILLDFYKNVNDSGGLNIGFDYAGDDREFTILSDRNEIDGGISIIKSGDTIAFSFQVFEPSTQAVTVYSTEVKYRKNYNSTLMFTFNAYTGRGVLSINGEVVYSFNTFVFGAVSDRILFGNVKVTHDETSADILIYTQLGHDRITNIHVSSNRLTPEAVDQLTLSRLRFNIDDITISIPCGMRNSTDRVKLLNSICFNQRSKSNSINVNVKNLGITDPVVLEDIKSNILIGLNEWIPVNTSINNFNFIDFK